MANDTHAEAPTWEPITLEELRGLGRRIDAEFVHAGELNGPSGLYAQLNTTYEGWAMLRAPAWCGDRLVALVVRPRED